jgi:Zn-dependent protease with chaperone function
LLPRSDTESRRSNHRVVFGTHLALAAAGLSVAAAAVADAAGSVHRQSSGAHEVVVAGQHFSYPTVNVAAAVLLALAALGATVLVIVARASLKQLRAHKHFVRSVGILGPLPGHPSVAVIDDSTPQAFCAGYLRPRVYVSTGALELLSADELNAVLVHEDHHRALRDPLRMATARILSQALFFLPALRPLGERYGDLAELSADEAAIRAAGETAPLAAALLAFDAGAPPGVAGISPERVDWLLGEPPRWRLPSLPVVASLGALSLLITLMWRVSGAASAQATFNLPFVASQPCMLILALLPVLAVGAAIVGRGRLRRTGQTSPAVAA